MENDLSEINVWSLQTKGDMVQLELDLKKSLDPTEFLGDLNELKAWRISSIREFDELEKEFEEIKTANHELNKKSKQYADEVDELKSLRFTLNDSIDKLRKYIDNTLTIAKAETNELSQKTSSEVEVLKKWRLDLTEDLNEIEINLKKLMEENKNLKDDNSSAKTVKLDIEDFKSKVQTKIKSLKADLDALESKQNKIGSAVKKLQKKEDDDF
jgi:chromosome segregation ATPase